MSTKNEFQSRCDNAPIIHLTFTGSMAGTPICGANRQAEMARGAVMLHATLAPSGVFSHSKLCHECKARWEGDDEQNPENDETPAGSWGL